MLIFLKFTFTGNRLPARLATSKCIHMRCSDWSRDGEGDEMQETFLQSPVLKAAESVNDVKVDPDLTSEMKNQISQLLQDYDDVLTDLPGRTTIGEHDIKLTTDEPIRSKPYPIPFALKETVKEEIISM